MFQFSIYQHQKQQQQSAMVPKDCISQIINIENLGPFCTNFFNDFKDNHTRFSDQWLNKNKET